MMDRSDWKIAVDSIDLGGMRLYHGCAWNEKTKQVIEGEIEDTDEAYVRAMIEQQLDNTLMTLAMEEQMRAIMGDN